jgi:amidase
VAPSLDHVGPLGRSIDDLRAVLSSLISPRRPHARSAVRGLRIGVPRACTRVALELDTRAAFDLLHDALSSSGASLVTVMPPFDAVAYQVVETISLAEGGAIFAAGRGHPDLSETTRAELDACPAPTSDAVRDARSLGVQIKAEMAALLDAHALDVLVVPAITSAVPSRGSPPAGTRFTLPLPLANVTGQPACVLPFRARPSPLAVQVLGRAGADDALLQAAALVEELAREI